LLGALALPISAAFAGAGGPCNGALPEPASVGLFILGAGAVVYLRGRLRG
jgi:hypothetical protein